MKEKVEKTKKHREINAGMVFGKIMAAVLVILMLAGTCATLIFALI